MKKVLVAEDEESIREFIVINLTRSGYTVEQAENGAVALEKFAKDESGFDVAILDIMMPEVDGLAVCKQLRAKSSDLGIIMLSAKTQEMDKITGLMFGADDYVEKPFSPSVLVARVKSQLAQYQRLKGTQIHKKSRITLGNISLDPDTHRVFVGDKEKVLPNKEFQVLEFLMVNADMVFSKETIYDKIWGMDSLGNTATVPVHINRLREAIEKDPNKPRHLLTIWGVGYKFKP